MDDLLEEIETYRLYMEAAPSGALYSKYRKIYEDLLEQLEEDN